MLYEWSEERIQEAIETFKPHANEKGEPFTREDAIESMDNLVTFFDLLIEWDRKQRKIEIPKLIKAIKQLQVLKNN